MIQIYEPYYIDEPIFMDVQVTDGRNLQCQAKIQISLTIHVQLLPLQPVLEHNKNVLTFNVKNLLLS